MSHPSRTPGSTLRIRAAAVLATLLVSVFGGVVVGTAPAHAAQHAIMIKQYAFMPGAMNIRQGDTITWTNQDSVGHDVEVTSGPATFHSPMLAQGQSWSFTFSTAGTYSYICSVHPDMRATVTVAAAPVQPAPQPATQPHQQTQHAGTSVLPARSAAPPGLHSAAARQSTPSKRTGSTPVAAAPAAAIVTPGSDAALDPLLLVGGVAVAVVVFCLLLLTSRPERPLLAAPGEGAGAHVAEPATEQRVAATGALGG